MVLYDSEMTAAGNFIKQAIKGYLHCSVAFKLKKFTHRENYSMGMMGEENSFGI